MSASIPSPHGPSRSRPESPSPETELPTEESDDFRINFSIPGPSSPGQQVASEEGDEGGEEDRLDIKLIQGFADKVQHRPCGSGKSSRARITVPKRGEKDFEPLKETVNLQEMMLQRSREALFNALAGVRGGGSKSMSHALLTSSSPYPRTLIVRGHLMDSMGITVRSQSSSRRAKGRIELLPEEALYLLERGSLQIWVGDEAVTETDEREGVGEWKDEEYGVGGAVELGVMDGFAAFIGKDGLSWERYQAYAYLKRLGYTVQRTRPFLPAHFTETATPSRSRRIHEQDMRLPPFRTWWMSIPQWIAGLVKSLGRGVRPFARAIGQTRLSLHLKPSDTLLSAGTLLRSWQGTSYRLSALPVTAVAELETASLFAHLRIIPTTHSQPLPSRPPAPYTDSTFDALLTNPYLPFWNVWKPATPWSKANWDKGSTEGIERQKPDYIIAVVEARTVPLPTIHQLAEVFDELPDEPTGPVKKVGPQYGRKPPARPHNDPDRPSVSLLERLGWKRLPPAPKPHGNPMGALRNGDRALIVAVNDSGNTGWVRFGRTGFAGAVVM